LNTGDRFGVTWHPSIATSIHANLERLDLIEVIPEGRFLESRRARRALRSLARTIPVSIHGVSLGLATASPVESHRLELFARVVGEVEPESWSEHLAFVRAGGVELGHLAAPPRTRVTVDATAEHLELAKARVGSYPLVENVATPIDPPGSAMSEETWLLDILNASPAQLLLDLHNLYANGTNFGFNPATALQAIPVERIRTIHIAGGIDVGAQDGGVRLVDDHLHDVPDPVYELLELVGERVPHVLDVVLERDGAFPSFDELLVQLDRARAALARGRSRSRVRQLLDSARRDLDADESAEPRQPSRKAATDHTAYTRRDGARMEAFLARLYTDETLRARFLTAPVQTAVQQGLPGDQARRFEQVDETGVRLVAASFARKREALRPR
jgi:uncharacterized protein